MLSNIIHLSREAHTWFHKFPADGRILCLLTKIRKGELDVDEIVRVSGMHPLGWAEQSEPRLEWIGPYLDELKQTLCHE